MILKPEVPLALLNAERVHGRPVAPETKIMFWQLLNLSQTQDFVDVTVQVTALASAAART